jgi:hypothetical protein
VFKAAALSTLLGIGTELSADDESDIARTIRESAEDSASDIGQQIVGRQLQYSADADDPARLPGARHRKPRSGDEAVWSREGADMT